MLPLLTKLHVKCRDIAVALCLGCRAAFTRIYMVDKQFQCLKAMFFGYLQAIGAGGVSMATANFLYAGHFCSI